jgi:beta-glucosidase
LLVEYRNDTTGAGHPVVTEVTSSSRLRLFGSVPPGVDPEAFHIRVRGTFAPAVDGPHVLSAVITGAGQVTVGAASVLDDGERRLPRGDMFFGLGCAEQTTAVDLETGVPVEVLMETEGRGGFVGLRLGVRAPDPPDLLERAVQAAAAADVALVVVGTNDEWETEGEDRTDIGLPGEQDGLVAAVAAVNNRTIVIVNAGSPVAMPWVDDVAAVVVAYFGGEEMAGGLVDVLLGERDPGGRLPVTYPRRKEDTPSWPHYAPTDGRQTYGEGMLVGYRGFDASEVEPLFPFGHGLSYGTAAWDGARLSSRELDAGGEVTLSLSVTCTSDRPVTDVVQVYVAPRQPPVVRPPKELKAWAKLRLQPGETEEIEITLGVEAFRRWDAELEQWVIDSGEYEVVVAASATDERARLALRIR